MSERKASQDVIISNLVVSVCSSVRELCMCIDVFKVLPCRGKKLQYKYNRIE